MNNLYFKEAKSLYFKKLKAKSSIACIYGFIIIACLIAAYFFAPILIILFPFIILPFTFAFFCANASLNANIDKPISIMFVFVKRYFSPRFNGIYRALFGFLKVLILYFVITIVVSLIGLAIIKNCDPNFAQLYDRLLFATSQDEMDSILALIMENPSFIILTIVDSAISFGVSVCYFFHHLFINSIKIYFALNATSTMPVKDLNVLNKYSFKKIRKDFYKNYYSVASITFAMFLIGYITGILLTIFIFKLDYTQAPIVGVFGGFILSFISFPFLFDMIEILFKKKRIVYAETLIEIATNTFNNLNKTSNISPEEAERIKEDLKKKQEDIDKNKTDDNK